MPQGREKGPLKLEAKCQFSRWSEKAEMGLLYENGYMYFKLVNKKPVFWQFRFCISRQYIAHVYGLCFEELCTKNLHENSEGRE